jgi:hypothetical protein
MSATDGLFGKYLNRIFIETGSNYGDGIQQALDEGFNLIYSVDILPEKYEYCTDRFIANDNVHLFLNDTVVFLNTLLLTIDEPVTFWLDAHKGNGKSPLLKELEVISRHHIKTHNILIDDLRDWKRKICGFDTDILKQVILRINPDYQFVLEDGFVMNDVLAAKI